MFYRLAAAENEGQQNIRLLADAEDNIHQLQHENELIEAQNKSLLTQQLDNSASFSLVSWKYCQLSCRIIGVRCLNYNICSKLRLLITYLL